MISLKNLKIDKYLITNIFYSRGLVYLVFVMLHALNGYIYEGIDDEIWVFNMAEHYSIKDIVYLASYNDVHPFGQYIYFSVLYKLVGSWKIVHTINGLLLGAALALLAEKVRSRGSQKQHILILLLATANPLILMFGPACRWYSIFLVIIILVIAISFDEDLQQDKNIKLYQYTTAFLIMGYLNYITILLLLPYIIYISNKKKSTLQKKIKFGCSILSIFIIFYSPQLYFFGKYHLTNSAGQIYSLKNSIEMIILTQLSNAGLDIHSAIVPISIIGTTAVYYFYLRVESKNINRDVMVLYTATLLIFLISGTAGRFRNLIVVEPLRVLVLSEALAIGFKTKPRVIYVLIISSVIVSLTIGTINVVLHNKTLSFWWSPSVNQLISNAQGYIASCNRPLVITNHYSLAYRLNQEHILVASTSGNYDEVIKYDWHKQNPPQSPELSYALVKESTCTIVVDTPNKYAKRPHQLYNKLVSFKSSSKENYLETNDPSLSSAMTSEASKRNRINAKELKIGLLKRRLTLSEFKSIVKPEINGQLYDYDIRTK